MTGAGRELRPLAGEQPVLAQSPEAGHHLASTDPGGIMAVLDTGCPGGSGLEQSVSAGGGEGVPEPAAEGAVPEGPGDVEEPVLGGPKDDPQEAIATHSGMWWPPAIEPETGEAPDAPEGTDAAGASPPAQPAES